MKTFDGYKMRGLTEKDDKIILQHQAAHINMTIDDAGRVYNEGGQYIADAEEVEEGLGVYCK